MQNDAKLVDMSRKTSEKNQCLPTPIAIYNHVASLFIKRKLKIAMYMKAITCQQTWLFSGTLRVDDCSH